MYMYVLYMMNHDHLVQISMCMTNSVIQSKDKGNGMCTSKPDSEVTKLSQKDSTCNLASYPGPSHKVRKTEYIVHVQTVCTRPSPRFVGGS